MFDLRSLLSAIYAIFILLGNFIHIDKQDISSDLKPRSNKQTNRKQKNQNNKETNSVQNTAALRSLLSAMYTILNLKTYT